MVVVAAAAAAAAAIAPAATASFNSHLEQDEKSIVSVLLPLYMLLWSSIPPYLYPVPTRRANAIYKSLSRSLSVFLQTRTNNSRTIHPVSQTTIRQER